MTQDKPTEARQDELAGMMKERARCRAYYEANKVQVLERQTPIAKIYQKTEAGKSNKIASFYRMASKYPEKYKARYFLRNAVQRGLIVKGNCEVCGTEDVESHHDDYSKPLEVRWFCHQHHCELEERWILRV